MKLTIKIFIYSAIMFFAINAARADDRHKHKPHNHNVTNETIINNFVAACDPVANAGNEIHHSNGTDDLQIGAGFAICDDGTEGGKVSLGQRFCPNCPLLNISAGKQNGKEIVWGFGFNWKVKLK